MIIDDRGRLSSRSTFSTSNVILASRVMNARVQTVSLDASIIIQEDGDSSSIHSISSPHKHKQSRLFTILDNFLYRFIPFIVPKFFGPLYTYTTSDSSISRSRIRTLSTVSSKSSITEQTSRHDRDPSISLRRYREFNIYYCLLYLLGFIVIISTIILFARWNSSTLNFLESVIFGILSVYMPFHITHVHNKRSFFVSNVDYKHNLNSHNIDDRRNSYNPHNNVDVDVGVGAENDDHKTENIGQIYKYQMRIPMDSNMMVYDVETKLFKHPLFKSRLQTWCKGLLYSSFLLGLLFVGYLTILGIYWIIDGAIAIMTVPKSNGATVLVNGVLTLSFGIFWLLPAIVYGGYMLCMLWYNELNCKLLLQKLKVLDKKLKLLNSSSVVLKSNNNDIAIDESKQESISDVLNSVENITTAIYNWHDNEYEQRWFEKRDSLIIWFDFPLLLYIISGAMSTWTSLSSLLDYGSDKPFASALWSFLIVTVSTFFIMIFLLFLCQTTLYYYSIRIRLNNMFHMKITRENDHLWKALIYVKHGVTMHSLKGEIFHYQVYWARIFRLTIVFALSKMLVYLFTAELSGIEQTN